MLQVLVDADNVPAARIRALLDVLEEDSPAELAITVAGHADAVGAVDWPAAAEVVESAGWQRADMVLATAYRPVPGRLVLVSGDGDFALLAARHPGPVLVVSEAAAGRFRDVATVIDPVHDGPGALHRWLQATAHD